MCVGGGGVPFLPAASRSPLPLSLQWWPTGSPRVTFLPHTSGLRRKGDSEKQGVGTGSEVWPNLACRRALVPTVPWPVSSRTLVAPA